MKNLATVIALAVFCSSVFAQQPVPALPQQPVPVPQVPAQQPVPIVQPAPAVVVKATNLLKTETDKATVPGASRVYEIYALMKGRLGFPNGSGHTMAAAVLARCMGPANIKDHMVAFSDMYKALQVSAHRSIARSADNLDAQASYIAATLTCKKLTRTSGEMVTNLDVIYKAILNDGMADWVPNAVMASELMQ